MENNKTYEPTLREQIAQEVKEKREAKLNEADAVIDTLIASAKWNVDYHNTKLTEERERLDELLKLKKENDADLPRN